MSNNREISNGKLLGDDDWERNLKTTLLAFLNSASEFELIAIWRIINYLQDYFENKTEHAPKLTENLITNAFSALRSEGLVKGYLRPSPLHRPTGSSLAIVLEEITPQGEMSDDNEVLAYFQSVVNTNHELERPLLKKTASNCELLKVLLEGLINENPRESLRMKAEALRDELM